MTENDGYHQGELARQFLDAALELAGEFVLATDGQGFTVQVRQFLDADLTGSISATFALDLAEIALSYCKGHPFPPPADFTIAHQD